MKISEIELTKAEVISLKKDDVVVFSFPMALSEANVLEISKMLNPLFPNNKIIVMDQGASISTLRAEETE